MMTDPIADMLSRIRNAIRARHRTTNIPASRVKMELARLLKQEGYIEDFVRHEGTAGRGGIKPFITVTLRYGPDGERAITGIERVSRSGLRVYVSKDDVPVVLGGLGVSIISTSHGLMTGMESRRRGLGGEVLCRIW